MNGQALPILPAELHALYERETPNSLLLLDVRSVVAHGRARARQSVNVSCSALQLRRLASGTMRLAEAVCEEGRRRLAQLSERSTVVLYDDCSDSLARLCKGPLPVFCAALVREAGQARIVFVRGGFDALQAARPDLCETSALAKRKGSISLHLPLEALDFNKAARGRSRSPNPSGAGSPAGTPDSGGRRRPNPMSMPPSQVLPYLLVGGRKDAEDAALLRRLQVTHVINVTTDCPNFHEGPLTYMRVPVLDKWGQDIENYFDATSAFIEEANGRGGCVLVHCSAGVSRSATIVIAYLMRRFSWPHMRALEVVRKSRRGISPNLDFMGCLVKFERQMVAPPRFESPPDSSEEPEAAECRRAAAPLGSAAASPAAAVAP